MKLATILLAAVIHTGFFVDGSSGPNFQKQLEDVGRPSFDIFPFFLGFNRTSCASRRSRRSRPRRARGGGISKATYATDDPSIGHAWLLEYVSTATDDVCMCEWLGEQFGVQQGRVYLDVHHEEPFGLHFVNVPAHWTTGGLHTRPSRLLASPLTPPALPNARTTTRCAG